MLRVKIGFDINSMNPLFKLFGINHAFKEFDSNIEKIGWTKACAKLINELGIKVDIKLEKFHRSKGMLVISNHVTGLDPFLLAGVLDREDSYCVCDVYQSQKGALAAKHIIPIYFSSLTDFVFKQVTSWPGFFIMRIKAGRLSESLARKENKKSLRKASKLVKRGKMVIMFPSGGEMKFRPWKKGVGLIAKELSTNSTIYKVNIKGLSELGLIWHFFSGRKYYLRHPVKIEGKKVQLNKVTIKGSPNDIAQYLKNL